MEILSKRIVALRASINMSQMKLSKEFGVSQSAIKRYENSQATMPHDILLKYAEFFNVSADYLLGRTDNPEGAIFKHEPEAIKRKIIREDEWADFVEACFDPRSPMNKRLKAMIMQMAGGEQS